MPRGAVIALGMGAELPNRLPDGSITASSEWIHDQTGEEGRSDETGRALDARMSDERRARYEQRRFLYRDKTGATRDADRDAIIDKFRVRNAVKRVHDLAEELAKSAPVKAERKSKDEKKDAPEGAEAEGGGGP